MIRCVKSCVTIIFFICLNILEIAIIVRCSSSKDTPTAMTHVIINSENCSRTCIHAPLRQEITQRELADHLSKLSDFSHYGWIHFDSRHTEAALEVAKRAKRDGCFMSIDAEKDRPPHMRELLSRCDIVFMSKDFAESILPSRLLLKNIFPAVFLHSFSGFFQQHWQALPADDDNFSRRMPQS